MRRRTKQNNTLKLLALAGVLILCIGGLVFAVLQVGSLRTPDKYGCFSKIEVPVTAVLVDSSEPRWNEQQGRALRIYLDTLFDELRFNERLEVYTTEGDQVSSIVKPRFHVCGQTTSSDELEADGAPSGNAGFLRKQKERLYHKVLAPELDALLTLNPDESRRQFYQSPILETIKAISRKLKFGDQLRVISDLLQNSDSMQACRTFNELPPFSAFKKRAVYKQKLKPKSLEGVHVQVLMLQRYGYAQGELKYCTESELQDFISDYFIDNSVESFDFIHIREGYTGTGQ